MFFAREQRVLLAVLLAYSGLATSSVRKFQVLAAAPAMFTRIEYLEPGAIRLTALCDTNYASLLQFSSNLADWVPVATLASARGPVEFEEATTARGSEGFYRLKGALGTNSLYWTNAQQTHNFTVQNLLAASGYRINPGSNTMYEWYSVSQIDADAAMVEAGDGRYASSMNQGYSWMNSFWDGTNPIGGYFSAANIDGTGKGGGKYVDDNALSGNVYLDCYQVSTGASRTNYLNSAVAIAHWLISSGQWDSTYGGGFWWSDSKTVKPTQSNGLALQLFVRLFGITGQTTYRDWANSVKSWLEAEMYDPADGLYLWQIETNGFKNKTKFTYDNAIMMEANLLYGQVLSNSAALLKVQNLASNLNAKLWDKNYKAYYFNSADGRVNPCWCGWASQAFTRLYEADGNALWLDYARLNIDYINDHLRNRTNGGYYTFCNMDGSNVDRRLEGVDQAWMQRVQALIARYR